MRIHRVDGRKSAASQNLPLIGAHVRALPLAPSLDKIVRCQSTPTPPPIPQIPTLIGWDFFSPGAPATANDRFPASHPSDRRRRVVAMQLPPPGCPFGALPLPCGLRRGLHSRMPESEVEPSPKQGLNPHFANVLIAWSRHEHFWTKPPSRTGFRDRSRSSRTTAFDGSRDGGRPRASAEGPEGDGH